MNEKLKWKIGETCTSIDARKAGVVKLGKEDELVRVDNKVIKIKQKSNKDLKDPRYTFLKRSGSQGYEFIGCLRLFSGGTTSPKSREWIFESGLEGTEVGKIFNDTQECCRARGVTPHKGHLQSSRYQDLWFPQEGNEAYSNVYDKKSGTLKEYVPNRYFFEKVPDGYKFLGSFKFVGIENNASIWELDMNDETLESEKILLETNHQLILTGAPGTGKTFMARRLAAEMIGCEVEELKNQEQFSFVQFHPGYDYSDFVIGLKPKLDEGSKQVVFEWKDGIFKTLCDKAKTNNKKFVMFIDEINRADLSRVFGELFFCLEEGYRGDEITLPNGEEFTIPDNVYIIGTMNDIDRSVESMDFALRRRFAWHEVKAKDTGKQIIWSADVEEADKKTALAKMQTVNKALTSEELKFGEAYKLGGAYFKKIEKYASAPGNKWDSLWDNHIVVILREYLRGRRDAEKALKMLKAAYDEAGTGSAPKNEAEGSIQQPNAEQ